MHRRLGVGRRSSPENQSRRMTWGFLILVAVFLCYLLFGRSKEKLEKVNILSTDGVHDSGTGNLEAEMLNARSVVRQLVDQMTLAKAYVVIAKENSNFVYAWELGTQIRACQRLLSMAKLGKTIELKEAAPVINEMAAVLAQAHVLHYDSATMILKLKAQLQALEERANAAAVQSTVFGQLAAEATPKSLYCLGMRLTTDWAKKSELHQLVENIRRSPKLTDNDLFHFCIFSDNILATSVAVNSTVYNSQTPENVVIHIVTDQMNFGAMQTWFIMNDFRGATIEVQNIDDYTWLNASYIPVLKQLDDPQTRSYYFKRAGADAKDTLKFRNPKYLSMLNHLRFYIPDVFPALNKIVFLDDDVVVQKDLRDLFSLNLHGNVNGAVETCVESFHRFDKYLNFSNPKLRSLDPKSCAWAFGMNVFDLARWKQVNVTGHYHYWQEQNADRTLWKLGTLPPGLLTFYGYVEPLDRRWHVLGLGYDPNLDSKVIEEGAVVHFNGNMKPWLKLAMSRYKSIWEQYVNYQHPYLQQCNIH